MTRYFGDSSHIRVERRHGDPGDPAYLGDRAPLTREEDKYGNIIDYYWLTSDRQGDESTYESPASYQIDRIEYTKNNNVAGGDPFAVVEFVYGSKVYCDTAEIAVGGVSDYHGGIFRVAGELPLTDIKMSVYDDPTDTTLREVRRVHLDYNEDQCTPNRSPIRQLLRITEIGTDLEANEVSTNPIEFSYGPTARAYDQRSEFDASGPDSGGTAYPQRLTWGHRDSNVPEKNSIESMLIDWV